MSFSVYRYMALFPEGPPQAYCPWIVNTVENVEGFVTLLSGLFMKNDFNRDIVFFLRLNFYSLRGDVQYRNGLFRESAFGAVQV